MYLYIVDYKTLKINLVLDSKMNPRNWVQMLFEVYCSTKCVKKQAISTITIIIMPSKNTFSQRCDLHNKIKKWSRETWVPNDVTPIRRCALKASRFAKSVVVEGRVLLLNSNDSLKIRMVRAWPCCQPLRL